MSTTVPPELRRKAVSIVKTVVGLAEAIGEVEPMVVAVDGDDDEVVLHLSDDVCVRVTVNVEVE